MKSIIRVCNYIWDPRGPGITGGTRYGTPSIPQLYGWWVTSPTARFLSIRPFGEDLYHYIAVNGSMCPGRTCRVASTNVSLLSKSN